MSTHTKDTHNSALDVGVFRESQMVEREGQKSEVYDLSNTSMADPANKMAIQPVQRLKLLPKPEHLDARVTTTHDVHGGGNPRLVMVFHDSIDFADIEQSRNKSGAPIANQVPKEFPLVPGVTKIGDSEDCDIWLPGLQELHAEIRRDKFDEYCLFDLSGGGATVDGGRLAFGVPLHSGRRLQIGEWTLIYERDESADHGSPYGGHVGGMFYGYRKVQQVPRPRGTSPEGGSEPTADDPGEYY